MAYTEPYPVITSWPSTTDGYPIGTKRCYHYTLTISQVEQQRATAFNNCTGSVSNTSFLNGLGLGLAIFGNVADGIIMASVSLFLEAVQLSRSAALINTYEIWNEIYYHMKEQKYQRVTISQLIGVEAIYGIDLFPEGFPVWAAIGFPRVPVEEYYYKV